jgi:trigger factor
MKTSLERLEPTKVKLSVEVEPERVSAAFDAAARDIAQQVQLPGFRKGKVPRRLLEAKIGKGALAQQAMESALNTYYAEAVDAEGLRVVAPPEVDLERFDEDEGCAFAATVEVRPEIELPDHRGIDVTFPEWDVTEEEVREQLDELRERFAELEEVDRPAAVGDYVTVDLEVTKDGEPIDEATVEDALYEVGSGGVTPQLDEELQGAVAGEALTYVDELPEAYPVHGGEEAEFTVTVKDVRAKELPDLDDDFAVSASEFDTVAELEDDIRANIGRRKLDHARQHLRARTLEAYLALVDVPLPEAMVEAEREARLEQLEQQAERYGLELDELLEMQDTDLEQVSADVSKQATSGVKAQLVLEALAEELGIGIDPEDLSDEIHRHAQQRGVDPQQLARAIQEQGSLGVLVGDVLRRRTLDALVEAADVTGAPTDEELAALGLAPPPEADDAPAEAAAGDAADDGEPGDEVPGDEVPGDEAAGDDAPGEILTPEETTADDAPTMPGEEGTDDEVAPEAETDGDEARAAAGE